MESLMGILHCAHAETIFFFWNFMPALIHKQNRNRCLHILRFEQADMYL